MNASKQGYLFQEKAIPLPSFEGDVSANQSCKCECDTDTEDDNDCDDSGVDDGQGVYDFLQDHKYICSFGCQPESMKK